MLVRLKPASEAEGRRFNSCRARQNFVKKGLREIVGLFFVWLLSDKVRMLWRASKVRFLRKL